MSWKAWGVVIALGLMAPAWPSWADELPPPGSDPFADFELPDAWKERFWADSGIQALLDMELEAVADLVPEQAGFRFCRCPNCDATEIDDPFTWSPESPEVVTCQRCGVALPNDEIPAKVDNAIPEETIEVLPRLIHRYPYHVVEPLRQRYPDERLYLHAKRDYEAREYLAKAAMYAAIRYRDQPPDQRDPKLAQLACVLVLRFAQVYPAYATHYDQPGEPQYLQAANLAPPYRRGYRTAKWDWLGCLDVPFNLVIAYALLREDPALAEAGAVLDDPNPARTIETDLFRASAEFVLKQPEEYQEMSLYAYRGLLAVGRLLDDPILVREAIRRLEGFAQRAFYHDGLWRQGTAASHRRVLGLIDGWLTRLLGGDMAQVPMLALAREAGESVLADPRAPEVRQAAWPAPSSPLPRAVGRPVLLGGAGLAHLAVGQGEQALDLEVCGFGSFGSPHFNRLALRLAVGGQPVLCDLDDLPPLDNGWDRATASHNTVVIDGLNQRETPLLAHQPAAGGDVLFFAADPDFQVATLDDPRAYPLSAPRYRQTVVLAAGPRTRYAVAVFEVRGGVQHDQLFHGPVGSPGPWQVATSMRPGPSSLLPATIPYLPDARAEEGRWFVQAFGTFQELSTGMMKTPGQAWRVDPEAGTGLRLHLMGDRPLTVMTGITPDPTKPATASVGERPGRAALIVRRESEEGATLSSRFVTVFEPIGAGDALFRVGRVDSSPETIVLYLETADGPEHLVINLTPGTIRTVRLADGRTLRLDGLAARLTPGALMLAGGTRAETEDRRVRQTRAVGRILDVSRRPTDGGRGWFETDRTVPAPERLAGRVLLIRHGDGTSRGWTLLHAENTPEGRARLHVREEPGFVLDAQTQEARYYQFPRTAAPGPHWFRIAQIARDAPARPE